MSSNKSEYVITLRGKNKKINGGTKMKATVGMKVTGYSGSSSG